MDTLRKYKLTKTERLARRRMIWNLWRAGEDDVPLDEVRTEVPDAWHIIVEDIDCHEPKEKVTLYLDRSVARSFRAMGKGYQARINRILQTWLQLKMANLLQAEAALKKRLGETLAHEKTYPEGTKRPGWAGMVDGFPQEDIPGPARD